MMKIMADEILDDVPVLMSGAGHDAMDMSHLTKSMCWMMMCMGSWFGNTFIPRNPTVTTTFNQRGSSSERLATTKELNLQGRIFKFLYQQFLWPVHTTLCPEFKWVIVSVESNSSR
ncbi:hypothetical protein Acr_00g0092150 [Actinidia rufa]|uniref:Uncharacterized protein n=1 Tax=Actinidia rufa TaxID=165716 RepID=A0A7J0DXQ1_9ERIC|nr:hypothetical protein Acr_00g0092150 [Actinidia rufa]